MRRRTFLAAATGNKAPKKQPHVHASLVSVHRVRLLHAATFQSFFFGFFCRDQGPIVRIAPIANGMEGNLVRAGKRGKPAKRRTQSPLDENARVESAQSRYVG